MIDSRIGQSSILLPLHRLRCKGHRGLATVLRGYPWLEAGVELSRRVVRI